MQDDIAFSSLLEVAEGLRTGAIDPVELTDHMLERIARLDGRLHSYQTMMADAARDAARRARDEIAAGRDRGPLHGVPIAVKDLCFTKGVRTSGGSGALAENVPDHDATVVARLEAAGAVLLGKLATTEGAMVGYHPDFAQPRNPWGADLWPGVSSSGSGVATAAGLCFASLGTDTGGSIRFPSSMNGIVGLKPTWGRVSRYGVLDLAPSLDHVGPMTRRVADAAVVLAVIAGDDPADPTTLPDPVPDYLAGLADGVAGLRLGYDDAYATAGLSPYYATAIRDAVDKLAGLGAEVVEVHVPELSAEQLGAWQTIAAAEAAEAHAATWPSRADSYGPWFRSFLEAGSAVTGVQYAHANELRAAAVGSLRRAFVDIEVLACPSTVSEAFEYERQGALEPPHPERGVSGGVPAEFFNATPRFTLPWNYTGYPTLSLPCGRSPAGLPLSLQLVARPLGEGVLCRAGHAFEGATEWHDLHPTV